MDTRILLPEGNEENAYQKTIEFIGRDEEYELLEQGQDLIGRSQIHFAKNGFNIEFVADDNSSKYSAGTLVMLHVQDERLSVGNQLDEASNLWEVIDAAKEFYLAHDDLQSAVYGVESQQGIVSAPAPDGEVPPFDRQFITWFDIYHPNEVESVGREHLLATPAPHVEELDDGAILVVSKHPTSGDSLDAVADHLGIPTWKDVRGPLR